MKPDSRLHTRHGSARTAGEKHQRTLAIVTGESPIGLTPTEMMVNREGFSQDQLRKLARDVDARHVQTREFDGKKLSHIEGWYAIAQANAIFGYAGWDREMVHFERVTERTKSDATIVCGYMARVRIRVRAGSTEIVREGTGWGSASASTATAANERALKSAETDATKRALSTFGSRFGLSLYDKDNVVANQRPTLTLFTPDGRPLAENLSPEGYSTGLRQLIELCKDTHELDRLSRHNRTPLSDLRVQVPTLRNAQGVHFSDLLLRLMQRKREKVSAAEPVGSPSSALGSSAHTNSASDSDSGTAAGRYEPMPAISSDNHRLPPTILGPGEAYCRYTGQSYRRRVFSSRSEVLDPKPAAPTEISPPTDEVKDAASPATDPSIVSQPAPASALPPPPAPEPAAEASSVRKADHLQKSSAATLEALDSVPMPLSKIAFGLKIDKSKLPLSLERRIRDKAHLRRVAELPCLVCNRQPSHAHHLRFAQRRGLSQKVSDEYVVPLCALHHGDLHRSFSEQEWWAKQKIEPVGISSQLWTARRGIEANPEPT